MARHALLWGLIFLGVIAAVGLWGDIRNDVAPRQSALQDGSGITVPRAPDGHYYLTLRADGTAIRFVVDTGATDIVLSQQDARRAGIDLQDLVYSGVAGTANGTVRTAQARIGQLQLGPITDRDVRVSVNQGEMSHSLLGMAYLQRFGRLEISNGTLVLER